MALVLNKPHRIFLLSPARFGGPRSAMLLRPEADFDVAVRLRNGVATLAEVYSFISGLYFRGKVAYSTAFGAPPPGIESAVIIAPGYGLLSPQTLMTPDRVREIGTIPVDEKHPPFREPLVAAAHELLKRTSDECQFVLLGSIATNKYTEPLLQVLGERLFFPQEFLGRGDMSRGSLMLRSAREGRELPYVRTDIQK